MNRFIYILLLSLLFTNCRKDKVDYTVEEHPEPTQEYVNSTIKGKVVGTDGFPINNVNVTAGENTTKTDFNGNFIFKDIKTNINGVSVVAEKPGYYKACKMIYPHLNTTAYVNIKMSEFAKPYITNTSENQIIISDKKDIIKIFDPKFKKNNTDYSGDLMVYWGRQDYKTSDIGDPVGYDKYFELKGLKTIGTMRIAVTDIYNSVFDLDTNFVSEIWLKIESLENIPVSSIYVWNFDNLRGKWIEKGVARLETVEDKKYLIADINQPGTWCFATKFEIEKADFKVNSKNNILPFTKAELVCNDLEYVISNRTDEEGFLTCFLPKAKSNVMNIVINNRKYSKGDINNVEDITIPIDVKTIDIEGEFLDCYHESIKNGYLTLLTDKDSVFYLIGGESKLNKKVIFTDDNTSISWFATDLDNKVNTEVHTTKVSESGKGNLGEVLICQEPFASVIYGDEVYLLDLDSISLDEEFLLMSFSNEKALFDTGYYPFRGEGDYEISELPPTIKNKNGENLFTYMGLDIDYKVVEYSNSGVIRGLLDCFVRTNFDGSDTTRLKVHYSTKIE